MTDLLVKLFGLSVNDAANVTRSEISFHGVNPLYIFLGAVALTALVVWMYRRGAEEVSAGRRYALTGLRVAFLVLILGLLLRPVLRMTLESSVRRSVLVLVDSSASMSEIKDLRSETEDLKRVALAKDLIDPARGLGQMPSEGANLRQVARLEVVKGVLNNPRLNLLGRLREDYELSAYRFDRGVVEISGAGWVEELQATGAYTAIGDAIREVISRKRGQPIAGIVLVTDGASNSGVQPVDAAALAGQEKVPLYVYGVGITSPKDVIVSTIFAPEVAFAEDEMPVTVRVRSMGMAGQSAKVMVHMGEEKVEKDVTFGADGEQLVTVNLTPRKKGEYDIRAYVPPRDDEVVKDNNAASQRIRVIDAKIKVLVIEQSPRWEFRYLQQILLRDRRMEAKFVLHEGDSSITRGAGSPYLDGFPRRKEDLFRYDVVVLGDVDPKVLAGAQLEALNEFVSKFGGAVVVLAGKRFTPGAYRGTAVEKMLPVELESLFDGGPAVANRPIKLELTAGGKASGMLRLAESELESAGLWAKLPAVYWTAKVARAKPVAEVLAVDPDPAKASRYGQMPVIASQQYGLGQVLYMGTDNLWRWRRNSGDRHHATLWGQVVQRMALPHLLGASKRTQLTSDQKTYTTGSKVTIFARLYTEGFEPMSEPAVRALYQESGASGQPREVVLRALPDRPGMYRGELIAPAAGNYELGVEHDRSVRLEFSVTEPKQELADTAMNEALLRQMAERSGGAFFREEDLHQLPEKIGSKTERLESTFEVELWSSPAYFLLMILVLTAEWILRKMSQLK